MHDPDQITYFAETDARNQHLPFGIKAEDRTKHVYVIGKTGMGKSTMLENMAVQDIRNGNGFAFLDPHGQTAETILEYIPEERIKDVLYFAPHDMEFPISFNVMEDVGYDKRHLVVSGLMSSFKKIWQDVWSARMEYILSNTLLALLEYPDATLLSVNKMLSDKAYRKKVVDNISDSAVKSFWIDEFANYTERMAAEAVPAIQNKVGQFTSNPLVRNIIGQPKSTFDIRKLMDEKKIMIVNLSKGRIGESNANLLGSMLITKIYLGAMSRADLPTSEIKKLPNFYLYVDEFQSFANESFADILSEARKYKLNLTIAHQYIEQMSDEVRAAVFGNVGTMISFRVGAYDAEVLEKEFAPTFTMQDIVSLGFVQIYLKLMIDGIGSTPFSARTLPPLEKLEDNHTKELIEASRNTFSRPRADVEEEVKELVEMGREEKEERQKQGQQGQRGGFNKNQGGSRSQSGGRYSGQGGEQSGGRPQSRGQDRGSFGNEKPKPVIDRDALKEIQSVMNQKKTAIKPAFKNKEIPKSDKPVEKETLSLKDLKDNKAKDDGKGAKPETKNDLKSALTAALGDEGIEIENSPEPPKNNTPKKPQQQNQNEIPEGELKKMLDVDK